MASNCLTMPHQVLGDFAFLPTKIEEIPKDILRMYGFILDGDDPLLVDDDIIEPGELVIDEERVDEPNIVIHEGRINAKIDWDEDIPTPGIGQVIFFCHVCKKLIAEISPEHHRKQHCFLESCPELILTETERERHKKIHDHPTKPLQCKLCRKRYKYYSFIEKHLSTGMCKKKKNFAKENWRKMTARNN